MHVQKTRNKNTKISGRQMIAGDELQKSLHYWVS